MDYERLILNFTSIIYEALPFIVLGVVIAGLLEEFLPQQMLARIMPKSRVLGISLGALLGSVFPMCECGIIVVMRRLLRKGLPLSVCVSYVLAGPIINVIVILSTYVAFTNYSIFGGPLPVVLLRAGLGFLVAMVTALVVEWQYNKYGDQLLSPTVLKKTAPEEDNSTGPRSWWDRFNNISGTALNDFVDIMAFLVIGATLAATGKELLRDADSGTSVSLLQEFPPLAILIMMGLAVAFCLCSEADAFVAANFSPLWPPAAKLAFLVLGPMLDLKLYIMYTRVFRQRLIWTIILSVVIQVFVYTTLVHYLWEIDWKTLFNG